MVSGEVYLAEIDHQWAEKAASGLKDERLTTPYIGRLVRSLAAVLDWGVRKAAAKFLRMLPKNLAQYADGSARFGLGSGAVVNNFLNLSYG